MYTLLIHSAFPTWDRHSRDDGNHTNGLGFHRPPMHPSNSGLHFRWSAFEEECERGLQHRLVGLLLEYQEI